MKITIQYIATRAGVSRGAVDKVIHNRPGVREEVRQRVLRVIAETGYVPIHAAPPEAAVQKRVAVILPRLNNPFFVALKAGMDRRMESLKDSGLTLEYYFCDATDLGGMLAVLDYLDGQDIHALLIRGMRSERLCARLNALAARMIPVILIDSDVPGAKRLCLVGEDCYKSGRIAASLLARSIGFRGEVALVGGSPEIVGHKLRMDGFEDAIRERFPHVSIVERVFSLEQSVIAYQRTCSLLDQYASLKGVFSLAGCAADVGQAILDRRRKGSVQMVCYNTTRDVIALIEKGVVSFSIGLAPQRQGELLVEIVCAYLLHGRAPVAAFVKTPISIGFDENMDALFEM